MNLSTAGRIDGRDSETLLKVEGMKSKKQSYLRVKIYLSEAEVKMVKRQARDCGLSIPDYLRWLVREDREKPSTDLATDIERFLRGGWNNNEAIKSPL